MPACRFSPDRARLAALTGLVVIVGAVLPAATGAKQIDGSLPPGQAKKLVDDAPIQQTAQKVVQGIVPATEALEPPAATKPLKAKPPRPPQAGGPKRSEPSPATPSETPPVSAAPPPAAAPAAATTTIPPAATTPTPLASAPSRPRRGAGDPGAATTARTALERPAPRDGRPIRRRRRGSIATRLEIPARATRLATATADR